MSTGQVWAAGFQHVTARSPLACLFKIMNRFISLIFQIFILCRGQPRMLRSTCIIYFKRMFVSVVY